MGGVATLVPDVSSTGSAGMIPGGDYTIVTSSGQMPRTRGRVLLNGAAALTITLLATNVGPGWAGNDNDVLEFVDVSGHAHVIKNAGGSTLVTLGGTKGNSAKVLSFAGVWILLS
jgi:hypothetical protein